VLRSPFLWKLYAGYAVLILTCCAIIGILVGRKLGEETRQQIRASLEARAVLLRKPARVNLAGPPEPSFQALVRAVGGETGTRITVIRADGTVIADSAEDPGGMDNHADRPEVRAAHLEGTGEATRFSNTLGRRMMYVALAVRDGDRQVGTIRTALPLLALDRRLAHIRATIALAAAVSALVALVLGILLTRHFIKPLSSMTLVADAMSRGDYDRRLSTMRKDEIGRLAHAFNRMAQSCSERTETIATDRNKFSAILAGMAEGVVAVNPEERVVHLNRAAGRLLGISSEESLGKPVWEVTRVREVSEILGQALGEGRDTQRSLQLSAPGKERIIEVHASPLRDGQGRISGAVAVLHDVSELHRLEQVRSEFVANASHELKTPITAIRGLVETLIEDGSLPADKRTRFLQKIKDQSLRLSSIVTDLLALSRLESKESELARESFDLRQVLQGVVKQFRPTAEDRGIELKIQVPAAAAPHLGDREALGQLVGNLLDNALKYTPAGGEVWIRLRRQGGETTIEVQDTGIGIEPQDQERIFERFYRVDKARSRELGGTGLGLSIVKHIARAQGGYVTVDSVPGAGSTFRVFLPARPPADPA